METIVADDPNTGPNWFDLVLNMRKRRRRAISALEEERNSTVVVYWNMDELKLDDFFTLADFLEEQPGDKNIDLVVVSPGGNGEAGFRIGHAFQQWANRNNVLFRVIVPLYAKSAATILALGAHEIVMGLHSEIGPIDAQIPKVDKSGQRWRYVPAMAVMDGLKLVGECINQLPAMSRFFEELLRNERLSLDELGLIERGRESGKQYGELLLAHGMIKDRERARDAVERLADYYKYHGHPIDAFDAEQNLGLTISHSTGKEWALIKALRDEFQAFVGQPDLIPGAMVTSVVETRKARTWRQVALDAESPHRIYSLAETWQERR
jgi:hypothetical protein